jgi:hypothetical protein
MKSIVDIGEPTITLMCREPGCRRKVGPYFELHQADMAMDAHMLIRHQAVYAAGQCPALKEREF